MAGSVNKVIIIGNLCRDPDVRQTNNGNTVVNLSIATNEKYKDSSGNWVEKPEYHNVVAFGTRGEVMGKHLHKGSPVYIEGQLQTRQWDDKDGNKRYTTEIVMRDFQFIGGGNSTQRSEPASEPEGICYDDIPF